MKIHTVGAELFQKDRQMDRHEEANSHVLQFYERAYKQKSFFLLVKLCQAYMPLPLILTL